jgi:RNA polymerase sigma-70 factor (ECF subfamily)
MLFERAFPSRLPVWVKPQTDNGIGELTLADDNSVQDLHSSDPEAALRERLGRGDVAAVAEAYDCYHQTVRAFARRLVGDNETTEDLVQEVFVTLPSAIRRFRGDATLKTFILSIAVNHSRHYVRAAARRRRMLQSAIDERIFDELPANDPESLSRRKQLAEVLHRALDKLPLDQRVAFVLSEIEDRTASEVARIVGAPEATVRTRLFHARKKLRSLLEHQEVTS